MSQDIKLPFYHKFVLIIVGLYALVSMLFVGKSIVVPLLFSIIFGILLSPLVFYLTKIKINRVIAIFIVLLSLMILVSLGFILFAKQLISFADASDIILERIYNLIDEGVKWISFKFDISVESVNVMLLDTRHELFIKNKNNYRSRFIKC